MRAECEHGEPVCVASAARLFCDAGYRIGILEWCAQCGAIRTLVEGEPGAWNEPSSAAVRERVAELMASEQALARTRLHVARGGAE